MQKLVVADLTVAKHARIVWRNTLPKSAAADDGIAMLQQLCRYHTRKLRRSGYL